MKKAMFIAGQTWDDNPTVILAKMIEQEIWFSKGGGKITFHPEEKRWATGFAKPPLLRIIIPFHTREIRISIDWVGECYKGKFKIQSSVPTIYKPRYSTTYEKTIEIVMENIETLLPKVQELVEADKKQERIDAILEQQPARLTEKFGMQITVLPMYTDTFYYKASDAYYVVFKARMNEDEDISGYTINNVAGTFTEEELQEILRVVGASPSAIASRMLK